MVPAPRFGAFGVFRNRIMPAQLATDPIHLESNPTGDFAFYQDYVIAEWHNPEFDAFDIMKMEGTAKKIYQTRPWGYISNRVHSTISNPAVAYQLLNREFAPRVVAIVTYSMRSHMGALVEKEYCKHVPIEIFRKLLEAQTWMQSKVNELKTKNSGLELEE